MAKAARTTVVEVEELVEPGQIQPHEVHVASVYVNRIVVGEKYEKRIERLTVRAEDSSTAQPAEKSAAQRTREVIARRAALEFRDGMYGE